MKVIHHLCDNCNEGSWYVNHSVLSKVRTTPQLYVAVSPASTNICSLLNTDKVESRRIKYYRSRILTKRFTPKYNVSVTFGYQVRKYWPELGAYDQWLWISDSSTFNHSFPKERRPWLPWDLFPCSQKGPERKVVCTCRVAGQETELPG